MLKSRLRIRAGMLVLAVAAAGLLAAQTRPVTETESSGEVRPPVALLCAANVDRLLEDLDYILGSADAGQHMERLRGIILSLNDLKGIDRQRPLGLLLYPPSAGGKDPEAVAFIPVSSMEDLQVSFKISNQVSLEPLDEEGRWELRAPDNTVPIRVEQEYAFIAQKAELLSGRIPDVADLTAPLVEQYDVALLVQRSGIPDAAIDQILQQIRKDSERDRERRENEADAEYQLRTRISQTLEHLIVQGVGDFEQVVVGLSVSEESRGASLEARLDFQSSGEFAGVIHSLSASSTQFTNPDPEASALAVSTAWSLSGEGTEIIGELLAQVRQQVGRELREDFTTAGSVAHPVRRVLDAADATVAAGRIDGMLTLVGDQPGQMVLVGAARIEQSADVATAIIEILPHVAQSKDVAGLELSIRDVDGVAVHRIVPTKIRKQDERLYGPDAALYVAAGNEAVWLALGGPHASDVLAAHMTASGDDTREAASPAPLLAVDVHLSSWIGLAGGGNSGSERRFLEAARLAFIDPEQDGMQLRLTTEEAGLRLAVDLDEGYVRLLGLALKQRLERKQ